MIQSREVPSTEVPAATSTTSVRHDEMLARLSRIADRSQASLTRSYQLIAARDRLRFAGVRNSSAVGVETSEPEADTVEAEEGRIAEAQARLQEWSRVHNAQQGPHTEDAYEIGARGRLLEWEAADLAMFVPEEMSLPRRQFALHLYETIRYANAMGMSMERLQFHIQDASARIESGQ